MTRGEPTPAAEGDGALSRSGTEAVLDRIPNPQSRITAAAGSPPGPLRPQAAGLLVGVTLSALLLVLSLSCGGSVPGPKPIDLGTDACAKCRNTITSLEAAAQVVYEDGRVLLYDDLGCLATDKAALEGGGQFYVQFADGKGWMRVEDVHFALSRDRTSPRGFNYFAYTEDEARQVDVDHWARGWGDVVEELRRREAKGERW